MNLLIGTPTYNDQVTTQYMRSILGLLLHLNAPAEWTPVKSTIITAARNLFASQMLERPYTHLLFVDSDMEFAPSAVARMLAFDKPLVACAYPMRHMDLGLIHQAARQIDDPEQAFAAALEYPVKLLEPHVQVGGFFRAAHAPAGLMLIKREVFEQLREAYPELYCDAAGSDYPGVRRVLQCFQPLYNYKGEALGEDVSFCRRWSALEGEIWVLLDEVVGHTGPYTFRGRAASPNA